MSFLTVNDFVCSAHHHFAPKLFRIKNKIQGLANDLKAIFFIFQLKITKIFKIEGKLNDFF